MSGDRPHASSTGEMLARLNRLRVGKLNDWHVFARHLASAIHRGKTVQRISEDTLLSPSTIRRWAFAATRLSEEDLRELEAWRDSHGNELLPLHVVELARLSRPRRQEILHEMLGRRWSVAQLRRERARREG